MNKLFFAFLALFVPAAFAACSVEINPDKQVEFFRSRTDKQYVHYDYVFLTYRKDVYVGGYVVHDMAVRHPTNGVTGDSDWRDAKHPFQSRHQVRSELRMMSRECRLQYRRHIDKLPVSIGVRRDLRSLIAVP
jgi:hypothetical protein